MNIFRFDTINRGYVELVRRILTNPDYHETVNMPGAGTGKLVNKKSRVHLRNVHIMFDNPDEFEKFEVFSKDRSTVMNSYMEKERVLFDQGIINANEMGKISKIWSCIRNPDNTINAN